MNFSTFLGFGAATATFLFAALTSTDDYRVFFDVHGLVIVFGGTFAAGVICFPVSKLAKLTKVAVGKMCLGKRMPYGEVIRQLVEFGDKIRTDGAYLKRAAEESCHPFLRESITLVNDGFTEDQVREILEKRMETHKKRYAAEANIFKTLGKFPPAFGLLGTTLGMIALLRTIGGADATSKIGPAMAIGLVATLYGITLTNFVFVPIGENLSEASREDAVLREIILEGVIMLKNKVHPAMIEEKLNSYLLPSDRISLKGDKAGGSKSAKAA